MAMANDPFELVGTTLEGKYDIESLVEQTVLSVVYRAMHRVWHRPVAVKAFRASTQDTEKQRAMLEAFVREGALLTELSERCAAICQARDVGAVITKNGDWVPYLILEWLEGTPLELVLQSERDGGGRRRTVEEAFQLLKPVAMALGLAHAHGIVHRDVKPGNVFLLAEQGGLWPCKLLDFGIAKVMGHGTGGREGAALPSFTPQYAAPEQFSSDYGTTGPWTDVYALALIFTELVTGREALEGDALGSLALQSCDPSRRPTPGALGFQVDAGIEEVLEHALALRPEARFPDAKAFWQALESSMYGREPAVSIPFLLTRVCAV